VSEPKRIIGIHKKYITLITAEKPYFTMFAVILIHFDVKIINIVM